MRVQILAFATASDAIGSAEISIELPVGSTIETLQAELVERFPDLAAIWPRLAIAVDGSIVPPNHDLKDGAEVALLPPVSGGIGAPSATEADIQQEPIRLVDGPLDIEAATSRVSSPRRGAVLLFLGAVRNHHQGRAVDRLTYEAYRSMAEVRLQRIEDELASAGDDLAVAIVHRLGEVPAGEVSVVIAVASPHRAAAYDASRAALERLKAEVPIWKREHYADGEAQWREEEALSGR